MNIDWTELLVHTVMFFFPAYIANLSPIAFSKLKIFKRLFALPLDGGKKLGGKRIFGKNKTVGGFIFGSLGGIIGAEMMIFGLFFTGYNFGIASIDYWFWLYLYFGLILGVGTMTGDLLKSFFKRRLGIKEGAPWWIFDQDDFILGSWLFSGMLVPYLVTWQVFLLALFITPPLHLLANFLAYKVGLKKVWW